ncbi:(2Fe-2S) ferredoxin domain-containing protein [Wenjunlia tyrosinilytica]|uniref:(2Fe-2S) ferredoxin domain-containing protein n=1 Tax=Wenjunlia tyrosinilytica TaxID=1544741 RepID=A0A917ZQ63_9ACTN|nr:(2Fe-2S) ferredoxin domain-containing protein [Wenjunlia tyrosinilytica]GGO87502.1 hypothetical protein GCM10012280_26100 [Wenjunlia tyrosinilytica]
MPPIDVVVCRGCCCGSPDKHPGTDHEGQVRQFEELVAATEGTRLVTSDCLGPCGRANVVVVRGRGVGPGGPRWFGFLHDRADVADLCSWISGLATAPARGPGSGPAPLPPVLDLLSIPAPGRRGR